MLLDLSCQKAGCGVAKVFYEVTMGCHLMMSEISSVRLDLGCFERLARLSDDGWVFEPSTARPTGATHPKRGGTDTAVADGQVVALIPAVAGG